MTFVTVTDANGKDFNGELARGYKDGDAEIKAWVRFTEESGFGVPAGTIAFLAPNEGKYGA